MSEPFTIINEHGLEIIGNTHVPQGEPTACAMLVHGFKGYKDYGFIPVLAHDLCAQGVLVHRFNLSTSGMTDAVDTFARPDLFAFDTWTRQIDDVRAVVGAIGRGGLGGDGLARILIGHSRGGTTALLAGGRHREQLGLSGIVTISAVDRCCTMTQQDKHAMLERGYTLTQSARTGQTLRIEASWLQEQLDKPEAHDVLLQASKSGVPVCVMHGDADDAVEICAGEAIAYKLNMPLIVLQSSNHVLNMPNPANLDDPRSVPLLKATAEIVRFIGQYANQPDG